MDSWLSGRNVVLGILGSIVVVGALGTVGLGSYMIGIIWAGWYAQDPMPALLVAAIGAWIGGGLIYEFVSDKWKKK